MLSCKFYQTFKTFFKDFFADHLLATAYERSVNLDKICERVLFFNNLSKKPSALLKCSYFASIFQGISLGLKHFVGV